MYLFNHIDHLHKNLGYISYEAFRKVIRGDRQQAGASPTPTRTLSKQ